MVVEPRFDEDIHALTRLRLCGLLRSVTSMEFRRLREILDISDANLSKTISALAALGYLETHKEASSLRDDTRRITRVALTPFGRHRFDSHLAALEALPLSALHSP